MKKQYLPQYQFKKNKGANDWNNAMMLKGMTRYASTLEEAQEVLELAIKRFNKGARVETTYVNGFGIDSVIDEQTADNLTVVKTRIKVREVTEWEIVE